MAPLGRSPLLGALVVRTIASETCTASGTCAEESTLLQLNKLKKVIRHGTRHVASPYLFGESGGGNDCPTGDVSEEDCLAASQSLLPEDERQGRTSLVAGSWGWVPPGCSMQTHDTHGSHDWGTHFNRRSGNNDGGYTKVCMGGAGSAEYLGCFVDDSARDLGTMIGGTGNAATNTFELCRAACGSHQFMSLQYGGECFCANSYGNGDQYVQVHDSECSRTVEPCSSNSHNCGGSWRQAIYKIGHWPQILVVPGYSKCNLNEGVQFVDSQAECEAVAVAAGHGFYSFRSNANNNGHKCFSSADCNEPLLGDRTNEWGIYANLDSLAVQDAAFIGCFIDDGARDLGSMVGGSNDESTNTFALCARACAGSTFMSLQYGGECFCSDSYGNGPQYVQVEDSDCDRACNNEVASHNCGGTWKQAIYRIAGAPEHQCAGVYEAEDATISGGVEHANTASANHQGFTGRSFVDYLHPNDDFVEWTVNSCSGGPATASFRYSLGSGNRPLQVFVNGEEVASALSFPATGDWKTWSEASVAVYLTEGANSVKLVAAGSSGANMDSLTIAGDWH